MITIKKRIKYNVLRKGELSEAEVTLYKSLNYWNLLFENDQVRVGDEPPLAVNKINVIADTIRYYDDQEKYYAKSNQCMIFFINLNNGGTVTNDTLPICMLHRRPLLNWFKFFIALLFKIYIP